MRVLNPNIPEYQYCTLILSWSHTFLVSHCLGLILSCSNMVTISHSINHHYMLGIEGIWVITSHSSNAFGLSKVLSLTLSHWFWTQICFLLVVRKNLEIISQFGTTFYTIKLPKIALYHREGEFNHPSSTIWLLSYESICRTALDTLGLSIIILNCSIIQTNQIWGGNNLLLLIFFAKIRFTLLSWFCSPGTCFAPLGPGLLSVMS